MARSLINHLSTRERKHASVGVGVGGLVPLGAIDRERQANATATATAAAVTDASSASNRKISLRRSFRRVPLALNVPSTRNVTDKDPTPSNVASAESVISSPSSGNKSGVSSGRSNISASTTSSPLSPLNKPLPPRPRRRSSPGLPSLPELPGSIPKRSKSTVFLPTGSDKDMGVLVPEPATSAQMERFRIRRTSSALSHSDLQGHRRRKDGSISKDGRESSVGPASQPAQSKIASLTRQSTAPCQTSPKDHSEHSAVAGKKRDSSGHPVQAAVPATLKDSSRHRAMTTDVVQVERDTLAHTLSETQGQIEAALTQLSRSQASERMLKAQLSALEARLEDSNSQRVDALEQNLFLEERLRHVSKVQNTSAVAAMEQESLVESRPLSKLLQAEERIALLEQQLAAAQQCDLTPVVTELTDRLRYHEKFALEKDSYIQALLEQNNAFRAQLEACASRLHTVTEKNKTLEAAASTNIGLLEAQVSTTTRLTHLERIAAEQEAQLNKATAEKAQLSGLLEGEVRRQAAMTNNLEHPNASQLGAFSDTEQTILDVKGKVSKKAAQDVPAAGPESPEQQIKRLQKEIDYHVQDIVLYKLDVKGYRKDLKRANAKIKKLTDAEPSRPFAAKNVAPSASPSLSCVSAATSSAPTSAYPTSPSPGTQGAPKMGPFPPPPGLFAVPLPTAELPDPYAHINGHHSGRSTPGSIGKSASSTPSTPTRAAAVQSPPATRQRSHTGPARQFTARKPVPDNAAPTPSHQRARSDVSPAVQPVEADSRALVDRGNRSDDVKGRSRNGNAPPRAIESHQGEAKAQDKPRNSLGAYGDVPNGGLPPMQMM